jgi:hypothetical protein
MDYSPAIGNEDKRHEPVPSLLGTMLGHERSAEADTKIATLEPH